jgi:hypothetical protein
VGNKTVAPEFVQINGFEPFRPTTTDPSLEMSVTELLVGAPGKGIMPVELVQ